MSRITTLVAVFLLPQYFTLWAMHAKAQLGINIIYWALFGMVASAWSLWLGRHLLKRDNSDPFPFTAATVAFFIVPYVISHLLGYQRANEIPPELAYSDGGFSSVQAWYLAHLGMSLLATVGIASALALALRNGLELSNVLIAAAVPAWPVVVHAALATLFSGLSLGELTSEGNRAFLQTSTDLGVHGNALGQYLVFAYVLVLGAAEGTEKSSRKSFFVLTAIMLSAGIVLSFSRTALGAWLLVTVLWNAKGRGFSKFIIPIMILCVWLLLPADLFQRVSKGVGEGDIDQILSGRLDHMWIPAIQDAWRTPVLGQGWGAYLWSDALRSGAAFQTATVHNAFLRLFMETGVVGLCLVVAFYLSVWWQSRRLEQFESDRLSKAMLKSCQWLVITMLVTGLTGDAVTPEMIQVYFWYGFGIFLWRRSVHVQRLASPARFPRRALAT